MSKHEGGSESEEDVDVQYDFSRGVRGQHAEGLAKGYKVLIHRADGTMEERDFALPEGVVFLDPDVRQHFPTNEMVNRTLRGLIGPVSHKQS